MTTDTVLDPGPCPCDKCAYARVDAVARAVVRAVRDAGTCPGTLTPLVEALSLALGDGPLWGPVPVDTEAPRNPG